MSHTINLWDFFEKYEEEDENKVKCTLCTKKFGQNETDDANLMTHLFMDHADELEKDKHKPQMTKSNERKNASEVIWEYFEVSEDDNNLAKCNYCLKTVSSTVTNLKSHLSRQHPLYYDEFSRKVLDKHEDDDDDERDEDDDDGDDDVDGPSKKAPGTYYSMRNRSKNPAVWKYFDLSDSFAKRAQCRLCKKYLSYRTTITNLKIHLKQKHLFAYEQMVRIDNNDFSIGNEMNLTHGNDVTSKLTRRIRTSQIWNYFTRFDGEPGKKLATCTLCHNNFSYLSTTGNLKRHLIVAHDLFLANGSAESVETEFKERVNRSPVWEYFSKTDDEKKMATCHLCQQQMCYLSTTSNLRKHLLKLHGVDITVHISKHGPLAKELVESITGDKDTKTPKIYPVWEYFAKSGEENTVTCKLCQEKVPHEGDSDLFDHLKEKHIEFQVLDPQATDAESNDSDSGVGTTKLRHPSILKKKLKRMWTYFNKVSITEKIAECKICKKTVSYKDQTNIMEHLRTKHSDVTVPTKDSMKKYIVSASGQLYEVDHDLEDHLDTQEDPILESLFIDEYKEPNKEKIKLKTPQKRKSSSYYISDSSDDDHLRTVKNKSKSEPCKKSDTLEYFAQYLVNLMKDLPENVSRKLQLNFIKQINDASVEKERSSSVIENGESSSDKW